MSLVSEAIARYHKLIESGPYIDLGWTQEFKGGIKAQKLDGRPVSPVLRPHFLTHRDYASLERATAVLQSAIERVLQMALANPQLMARLQLLPAERMSAAVDPGYKAVAVTSLLDSAVNDGELHVTGYRADVPAGVLYGEALADAYYDCAPMKEFRK